MTSTFSAVLLVLSCVCLVTAHYHSIANDVITGVKLSGGRDKRQTGGRQPIRITKIFDTSVDTGLPSDKSTMIKEDIVPKLINFLTNSLSVDRVQSPILLNRACQGGTFFPRNDGERDCEFTCVTTTCGEVTVPNEHLKGCTQCDGAGSNSCSQISADGAGVGQTDVVLYVSAVATNCPTGTTGGSQTVAFARHCQMESDLDRPIAGNINFCPDGLQGNAAEFILELAKHETTHALAFATSLFAFWRDQNGNPRTSRGSNGQPSTFNDQLGFFNPSANTVRFNQEYTDWVTFGGQRSHTVHLMVTPAVLREARSHFGCPSLAGVELENQGGTGTFLSHWEKRILGNEAMTGELTFNPVFSRITLAAYEDSGWYDVNYDMAGELLWGRNAGCGFATGSCLEWTRENSQNPSPFCTDTERGCTVDHEAVSQCNLGEFTAPLDADYRYFSNSAQGGTVQIADFCPFQNTFNIQGQDGVVRGTECSMSANTPSTNVLQETYGQGSRCIRHGTRGWTNPRFRDFTVGSGCYQYFCSPSTGVNIVVGGLAYRCECEGQEIHFDISDGSTGSFICPSCTVLCYDDRSNCPSSEPAQCFGSVANVQGNSNIPVTVGSTRPNGGRGAHTASVVMTTTLGLFVAALAK